MNIECPHCHFEYKPEDIAHTLKNGNFKCPICGKKIPSPEGVSQRGSSPFSLGKYLIPVFILLGIAAVFAVNHFSKAVEKTVPRTATVAPVITPTGSTPPPEQTVTAPASPPSPATQTDSTPQQALGKMQIVERIAAGFHKTHTYTLEADFVCLDMAIDVWNQLKTYGIESKIMGGNIKENITAWNYRQLVWEGNHAWVVAKLSPTEKVAIETTAGIVIKPGMENAPAYFKGIEFDDPGQIKRFELLRKKAHEVCRDRDQLINDWNRNVAGKQRKSEETIAKQSRIEQRKQDCESTFKDLKEFESKAIFY